MNYELKVVKYKNLTSKANLQQSVLTMWKSAKRQPVAPGSWSNVGVRTDHEVIISGSVQSFDHDEVVGGVCRPVFSGRSLLMVENLIQHDLTIAVFSRRRIPL